jgi:hypothetical protein
MTESPTPNQCSRARSVTRPIPAAAASAQQQVDVGRHRAVQKPADSREHHGVDGHDQGHRPVAGAEHVPRFPIQLGREHGFLGGGVVVLLVGLHGDPAEAG